MLFRFAAGLALASICSACAQESARAPLAYCPTYWTLRPDLTFDDTNAPLTEVREIAISRSGEIIVAEEQSNTILVFSPSGQLLRTIGGRGDGPGEFRKLVSVATVDDSIWGADSRHRRGTLFQSDARVIRTVSFTQLASIWRAYPLGENYLVIPAEANDRGERPLLVANEAGIALGTLGTPLVAERIDLTIRFPAGGMAYSFLPTPSVDLAAVGPAGNSLIIGRGVVSRDRDGRLVELTELTPAGDTAHSWIVEVEPALADPGFVAARKAELVERYQRYFSSAAQAEAEIERGWEVAAQFDPVADLFVGADSRIWIKTSPIENKWIVVQPRGAVEACAELPSGVTLKAAAGEAAWGVHLDELDVPTVVRLRWR